VSVVKSIATSQVVDLRLAECWTAYCGHRTDKGGRPNEKHAAYWLTTVMVPKRRDEAPRSSQLSSVSTVRSPASARSAATAPTSRKYSRAPTRG
jgi:hypothetical protein